MRRRMVVGALLLSAAPGVLLAPSAGAAAEQDRVLAVAASAWTWRPTLPVGEPSNVPRGGLAIQFDGRPSAPPAKATYLRLALGSAPAGSTVMRLTLVVPLDPSVDQDGAAGPVVACALAGPIVAGEGVDPSTQPAEDCTAAVPGRYDAAGNALVFDLAGLAQGWLDGQFNHGVVLRPDPAAALPAVLPFQLTLRGPGDIAGRLALRVPDAAPVMPEQAPVEPVAPAFPQGPISSGFVPAPSPELVAAPPVAAPLPPATAEVRAAVPAPAAPVVRTIAPLRASQAGLAAGLCLGLLLLLLAAWSLGDAAHPRAYVRAERRRRDRLARTLVLSAQPRQRLQGSRPINSAASTVT